MFNWELSACIAAYKLFEVDMYRQRLRERCRRKETGKGFSIMHNATTFGWKGYRAMWKKRTREERFVMHLSLNEYGDSSNFLLTYIWK